MDLTLIGASFAVSTKIYQRHQYFGHFKRSFPPNSHTRKIVMIFLSRRAVA